MTLKVNLTVGKKLDDGEIDFPLSKIKPYMHSGSLICKTTLHLKRLNTYMLDESRN